ncbi:MULTISPECIES: hypothetical protein [Actinomadura]|uniref:hypothetical protein n=1 Tax=Actinomadura sp. NPDC000929 TaxID=3154517 RepID=UPI0033938796
MLPPYARLECEDVVQDALQSREVVLVRYTSPAWEMMYRSRGFHGRALYELNGLSEELRGRCIGGIDLRRFGSSLMSKPATMSGSCRSWRLLCA